MSIQQTVPYVTIDKLLFDPENPRLPSNLKGRGEADMLEWLLRDASILDLMRAIGERDYFSGEPLLVVSKSSKNGYFVVVEGNRRLCAVDFLTNPNWLLSESP